MRTTDLKSTINAFLSAKASIAACAMAAVLGFAHASEAFETAPVDPNGYLITEMTTSARDTWRTRGGDCSDHHAGKAASLRAAALGALQARLENDRNIAHFIIGKLVRPDSTCTSRKEGPNRRHDVAVTDTYEVLFLAK